MKSQGEKYNIVYTIATLLRFPGTQMFIIVKWKQVEDKVQRLLQDLTTMFTYYFIIIYSLYCYIIRFNKRYFMI